MRMNREVIIFKNQFEFMLGCSTIKIIHLVRKRVEEYGERKKELHMLFIYL